MHKVLNGAATYPKIEPFDNEDKLIAHTKARLALAAAAGASLPSVMVMGALGRCGTGACDFAVASGIDSYYFANHRSKIVRWDMEQTRNGGPFPEIMQNDIFVNCIYLSQPIPPFVSAAMLNDEKRALSVICDVACDPTNPHNPLPFYSNITTFDEPLLNVPVT